MDNDKIISLLKDIVKISPLAILFSIITGCIVVLALKNLHVSRLITELLFPIVKLNQTYVITPIVEELFKFFAYAYIFLIDARKIHDKLKIPFKYKSNQEFIQKNIIYMAATVAITFSFLEGIIHYLYYGSPLIEIFPHTVDHVVFILIPVFLWMLLRKNIIYFLPVAIIAHMFNNFHAEVGNIYPISFILAKIIVPVLFVLPLLFLLHQFKTRYKTKKIIFL